MVATTRRRTSGKLRRRTASGNDEKEDREQLTAPRTRLMYKADVNG